MLPQRFQRLRSVRFSTAFQCPFPHASTHFPPDDGQKWAAACQVLGSLHALEDLHITIAIWSRVPSLRLEIDEDSVIRLLEPLKTVRALRFSVTLSTSLTESMRERLGALPFQVLRRERPGIGFYNDPSDF